MPRTIEELAAEVAKIAAELDVQRPVDRLARELDTIASELDMKPGRVALSALQQEYRDYFLEKLEEHGVSSPASLPDAEAMKQFFNDIKDGWVKGKGRKSSVHTASGLLSPSSPPDATPLSNREHMMWWDAGYEQASKFSDRGTVSIMALFLDGRYRTTEDDPQFYEKLHVFSEGVRAGARDMGLRVRD